MNSNQDEINPNKNKLKTCRNDKVKLEFNEISVKQGFIWSIILGEPACKKRR